MAEMKIYRDEFQTLNERLENVDGWHKASIRQGLYQVWTSKLTAEFVEWRARCQGMVVIQREPAGDTGIVGPSMVYFQFEEDLVNYLLTFEAFQVTRPVDTAFFYAPYVPSMTSVILK